MRREPRNSERVAAFSDGVIAVIITIMVLELKPPEHATIAALWPLWPTLMSYAVSYLFVAIVWINHHHLLGLAKHATMRLIWSNFAFLFTVSLVPFATAWLADTRLAPAPATTYAAVFVLVNVSYLFFEREALGQGSAEGALHGAKVLRRTSARTFVTLGGFLASALLSAHLPRVGLGVLAGMCAVVPCAGVAAVRGRGRRATFRGASSLLTSGRMTRGKVRQASECVCRARDEGDEGRQASLWRRQRPQGEKPEAGDCHRAVGGASRRREAAASTCEKGCGEESTSEIVRKEGPGEKERGQEDGSEENGDWEDSDKSPGKEDGGKEILQQEEPREEDCCEKYRDQKDRRKKDGSKEVGTRASRSAGRWCGERLALHGQYFAVCW